MTATAVARATKVAIIVNPGSGTGDGNGVQWRLHETFTSVGHDVRVTVPQNPDDVRRAVEDAIAEGVSAVIVAGGDGTVSAVAGLLAGTDIPLGVIPRGTLNHFAKDLGLPLDLDAAAAVIEEGFTTRVDVGEVNGRVFVNNSSLGLYPLILRLREQRPSRGIKKWAVAAWATLKALQRQRAVAVRLNVDNAVAVRRTPLLFVGNNQYRAAGLSAGSRESLTGGELCVYVVKSRGKWGLWRMAWKIFIGTAHEDHELDVFPVDSATIESKYPTLEVSLDGEVETLQTPLVYRTRPADLRVFVMRG